MTGCVRAFLPGPGKGLLQADSGEELPFSLAGTVADLQGGDVVEFDVSPAGAPSAINVRLQHRWADLLNERERALVNDFHQLLTSD